MTTTTSLAGLLPLVLFSGVGSELYRGVSSIALGGLAFSTVLSLFVVPVVFTLLWRGRRAASRLISQSSRWNGPRRMTPLIEGDARVLAALASSALSAVCWRPMRTFLLLCFVAFSVAACPSGGSSSKGYRIKNDATVCPEYRNLTCLTDEICSMDSDRGCRVCRCDTGDSSDPMNPDSNTVPPR